MTACPSPEELQGWVQGQVTSDRSAALETHIEACPACQTQVGSLKDASDRAAIASPAEDVTLEPSASFLAEFSAAAAPIPPAPAATAPLPEVPGYEILRELGRGGMAIVYLARHQRLKRLTALKFLNEQGLRNAYCLARFRTEAEAIARLKHASVLQIYEIGEHAGRPFVALEYVTGGTLAQYRGQALPVEEAVRLIEGIARGVQAVHEAGIIHRDLKPSNILLESSQPKVSDFGLARLSDGLNEETPMGALLGTPQYMSPEQANGDMLAIGPATDIYALGAIFYELLVGKPPLVAPTVIETLRLVRECPPVPPRQLRPELPASLEAACLRCLAKNPAERFPSARALADSLAEALTSAVADARDSAQRSPLVGRQRSARPSVFWGKVWLAATLIGTLAAALLILVTIWGNRSSVQLGNGGPPVNAADAPAQDPLPQGSRWEGTFAFLPAPPGQIDGDVSLQITTRDGRRFTGTYQTENQNYEWKVAGILEGTAIHWEFTEAVRDNADGNVVGKAYVQGTLSDGELRVEFIQRDSSEKAAMRLRRAP